MSTQNDQEVEVKIAITDLEAVKRRLRELGFRESVAREFEANTLYDTSDRKLRRSEMLLRLREVRFEIRDYLEGTGNAGSV